MPSFMHLDLCNCKHAPIVDFLDILREDRMLHPTSKTHITDIQGTYSSSLTYYVIEVLSFEPFKSTYLVAYYVKEGLHDIISG
jgi:hypothetical protein